MTDEIIGFQLPEKLINTVQELWNCVGWKKTHFKELNWSLTGFIHACCVWYVRMWCMHNVFSEALEPAGPQAMFKHIKSQLMWSCPQSFCLAVFLTWQLRHIHVNHKLTLTCPLASDQMQRNQWRNLIYYAINVLEAYSVAVNMHVRENTSNVRFQGSSHGTCWALGWYDRCKGAINLWALPESDSLKYLIWLHSSAICFRIDINTKQSSQTVKENQKWGFISEPAGLLKYNMNTSTQRYEKKVILTKEVIKWECDKYYKVHLYRRLEVTFYLFLTYFLIPSVYFTRSHSSGAFRIYQSVAFLSMYFIITAGRWQPHLQLTRSMERMLHFPNINR